jgi:hypothetical protein
MRMLRGQSPVASQDNHVERLTLQSAAALTASTNMRAFGGSSDLKANLLR